MKSPYLAKTLLLLGLFLWGFSEWNIINSDASLQNSVEVFDYDFGDQKTFPRDYKMIVDWGNQQFVYGSGQRIVRFTKQSSWTYDMSWIPFFKSYQQKIRWKVEGLAFDRQPIEVKLKSKRFGFVSRAEMLKDSRTKASKALLKSFQERTFYQIPFLNRKTNPIFNKCF